MFREAILLAGVTTTASAGLLPGVNAATLPLLNVSAVTLMMAGLGAMCSFAWQKGESTRGRLFVITFASMVVGGACVGVIPGLFEKTIKPEAQPPLALLCGLVIPWIVPAAKGALPTFFKALSVMFVDMVRGKVNQGGNNDYGGYGGYGGNDYGGHDAGEDGEEPRVYKPRNKKPGGE